MLHSVAAYRCTVTYRLELLAFLTKSVLHFGNTNGGANCHYLISWSIYCKMYRLCIFICFVWISEQTAIISLYNINWLVFITETESVYCAVRTGCCNIIQPLDDPLKPSGHYMYHQFNIQQFYVLPTHCIYLFCVDLRTNSHYFPIQH